MRWNISHVLFVESRFCYPRLELQHAEILFSPHFLLQNLSMHNVRYVRISGAATNLQFLQQELRFKKISQARDSRKPEMQKLFLRTFNDFWALLEVRTIRNSRYYFLTETILHLKELFIFTDWNGNVDVKGEVDFISNQSLWIWIP